MTLGISMLENISPLTYQNVKHITLVINMLNNTITQNYHLEISHCATLNVAI